MHFCDFGEGSSAGMSSTGGKLHRNNRQLQNCHPIFAVLSLLFAAKPD
jgi:hypothetical protein